MVHTQSVTYVRSITTRLPVASKDSLLRVCLGTSTILDTKGHITAFKTIAIDITRKFYKAQIAVSDTLRIR